MKRLGILFGVLIILYSIFPAVMVIVSKIKITIVDVKHHVQQLKVDYFVENADLNLATINSVNTYAINWTDWKNPCGGN